MTQSNKKKMFTRFLQVKAQEKKNYQGNYKFKVKVCVDSLA